MARKVLVAVALLLVSLLGYAIAVKPPALNDETIVVRLAGDPEQWIAARERKIHEVSKIIPGAEKRIRWFDPDSKARTSWAVVYFHGYSASRQEIAPVPELVADALGANLFESRLSGHGIELEPLKHATAEDWLADGLEGLEVGAALGEHVVVIGTSTGATLALSLAKRPEMATVSAFILISPNFAPMDSTAELLTWPGGLDMARLTVGDARTWTPRNDLQAKYWTTTYPMESLVEMMRLVKYLRAQLPMQIDQRVLTIYSPQDRVVNPAKTLQALKQIDAPQNVTWKFTDSADEGQHVLIGNILAPASTAPAARLITEFVLGSDPALP
jgi:esterase/lipase